MADNNSKKPKGLKQSTKKKITTVILLVMITAAVYAGISYYKKTFESNAAFRNTMQYTRMSPQSFFIENLNRDMKDNPQKFEYLLQQANNKEVTLGSYMINLPNSTSAKILNQFFKANTTEILKLTPVDFENSSKTYLSNFIKEKDWTSEQKDIFIKLFFEKFLQVLPSSCFSMDNTTIENCYNVCFNFNEKTLYTNLLSALDNMYQDLNFKSELVKAGNCKSVQAAEEMLKSIYKDIKGKADIAYDYNKFKYQLVLDSEGYIISHTFIYDAPDQSYAISTYKTTKENGNFNYKYKISQFENNIVEIDMDCHPSGTNNTYYGTGNIKIKDSSFVEIENYDFDFQDFVGIIHLF